MQSAEFLSTAREMGAAAMGFMGKQALVMISKTVAEIPILIVKFILFVAFLYFILLEGPRFHQYLRSLIPLKNAEIDAMETKIKGMIHGVIYGAITIGILQAFLAMLGYVIAGAPSPILFGVLTIPVAFIPFVGTALVWVPLSSFILTTAIAASDDWGIARGVFLIVYSIVVVSSVDNILKPILISKKAGVHPLLVFLGVLGGLQAFGIIGFLIGPVCLSLLVTMLGIIRTHYFGKSHHTKAL